MGKESITTNITVKRPINAKEKQELLAKIVESDQIVNDLVLELKEYTAEKKENIEQERMNISRCCRLARDGFEPVTHECTVKYEGGNTQFMDIRSGEVVDEHPTTDEEQLRLNDKWVDAEQVIRDSSKAD